MLNYNKGFFYSLRETQCHGHVLLFFLLGNLFFSYSVTLLDKLLALFLFDAFWMFSVGVFFCDAFLVVSLAVFPSAVILVVFLAFFVFDPFLVVPLVFFLFAPPWNDCDLYMIPSSWTKASCLLCFSFLLFFFFAATWPLGYFDNQSDRFDLYQYFSKLQAFLVVSECQDQGEDLCRWRWSPGWNGKAYLPGWTKHFFGSHSP